MLNNALNKYNKLKRFSAFVSDNLRDKVEKELPKIDCLFNGDIYTKRDMFEKLDAIAACASLVELRKYETGETVIHNANYCHNPVVCPVCADRVSKRRRAIFSDPLKKAVRRFAVDPYCTDWKAEYPAGYTGVYMATATIKNGEKLKERIDTLFNSIKRMRKMGQKRKKIRSLGEWSKVRAGISNTEIKIGSGSGSWHVHSHFLIFTDSPIDMRIDGNFSVVENGSIKKVSKFNYEWFVSTRGEGINFDLKPVQFRKNINGRECKTFEESVEAQAQEVLKYSTLLTAKKGTNLLSARQYVELIQRRGNRRLFNPIGLLRCDKRNPDSFTTITERELHHLEYVESMDKKCYEIYSATWQRGGGGRKHFKTGCRSVCQFRRYENAV
jgi:plasmid rolling circle replication initiator protein Rep